MSSEVGTTNGWSLGELSTVYHSDDGILRVQRGPLTSPDGANWQLHIVETSPGNTGAVCVVVDHEGQLLIADHWRATTEKWGIEFPRGMGEAGESALATARRELLEETGIKSDQGEVLGKIHADTGILRDDIAVVEFRVAAQPTAKTDGELGAMRWITVTEFEGLIAAGKITDGITLAAFSIWRARKTK